MTMVDIEPNIKQQINCAETLAKFEVNIGPRTTKQLSKLYAGRTENCGTLPA